MQNLLKRYKYSGTLIKRPFPDKLFKSDDRLHERGLVDDFSRIHEFNIINSLPVLVNFDEHLLLLATLLNEANQLFPENKLVLLQLYSCNKKLSPLFLQPTVFLVGNVENESKNLSKNGVSHLTIEDTIIKYKNQYGTNHINIEYKTDSENRTDKNFSMYVNIIKNLGFSEI